MHLQTQHRKPKFGTKIPRTQTNLLKLKSRSQTPIRSLQHHPQPQFKAIRTWGFFAPSHSTSKTQLSNKDSEDFNKLTKIQVKIPNSNQEPPASSAASIEGNKEMRVLCTFKFNIENPNSEQRFLGPKQFY